MPVDMAKRYPQSSSAASSAPRPLYAQIYEGPEAIDECGIAALLSAPLAAAGMEVLYISTFNSDLILVSTYTHAHTRTRTYYRARR